MRKYISISAPLLGLLTLVLLAGCPPSPKSKQGDSNKPPKSADAGAEVLDFLHTGQDAKLGNDLVVRPDGSIASHPTLRCAMMEKLREVNPRLATAYAKELVDGKALPPAAELALAGRALALDGTTSDDHLFLQRAAQIFLNQEEWFQKPNRAVLECFDLVVFGFTPQILPAFERLGSNDYPESVQYACEVVVHRMALTPGHPVRAALNDDFALWSKHPDWRGKIFAHSDVRDPADARELERFLKLPTIKGEEREMFTLSFPAAVFEGSSSLIYRGKVPTLADTALRDLKSLDWLAGLQIASFSEPSTQSIRLATERLRENVADAKANGLLP